MQGRKSIKWSRDALREMERVPFFIRKMVRKRVEDYARDLGCGLVSPCHLESCRQQYLENMEQDIRGYRLETCLGANGCKNRVMGPTGLVERLEHLLAGRDLKHFLKSKASGSLKMHHEFRVSVSFCPNACSRPQIVDVGLIGAVRPLVASEKCTGCRACIRVCREGAISIGDGSRPLVRIRATGCLYCGSCARSCPVSAIENHEDGFRILVGGKLGRHPRLAHELPGIFSEDKAVHVVERVLDFYTSNCMNAERLGAVVSRTGLEELYRFIGLSIDTL